MTLHFPKAAPPLVERYSPTLVNDLTACGYRAAFRMDKSCASLRRPNPWTALGNVVHSVNEAVTKGAVNAVADDAVPEALSELWSANEALWMSRLVESWPGVQPPEPTD